MIRTLWSKGPWYASYSATIHLGVILDLYRWKIFELQLGLGPLRLGYDAAYDAGDRLEALLTKEQAAPPLVARSRPRFRHPARQGEFTMGMTAGEYRVALDAAKTALFAGTTPADKPKAVVIMAPDGVDVGDQLQQALAEFADAGGAVVLDPEKLVSYHPRLQDLANPDGHISGPAVSELRKDVWNLLDDLQAAAVAARRNLVIVT